MTTPIRTPLTVPSSAFEQRKPSSLQSQRTAQRVDEIRDNLISSTSPSGSSGTFKLKEKDKRILVAGAVIGGVVVGGVGGPLAALPGAVAGGLIAFTGICVRDSFQERRCVIL